jgi:hypothetical protein
VSIFDGFLNTNFACVDLLDGFQCILSVEQRMPELGCSYATASIASKARRRTAIVTAAEPALQPTS